MYGPAQELHLHKHQQLGVIVQWVDPQVHSQALAQAQIVESQAVAYVPEVQQQAQSHVQAMAADMESQAQSRVQAIEQQAQARVSEVSIEASRQLAVANDTIVSLKQQNEMPARQQQYLYSQIATLQNMVAEVKASAVNTSIPQIPSTQNGAESTEALKAMASQVGQTMNELQEAVIGSPKAKGRSKVAKAPIPYFSSPPPYACERSSSVSFDKWARSSPPIACAPPPYACERLPVSSSSSNTRASPVFTTSFGFGPPSPRASSAAFWFEEEEDEQDDEGEEEEGGDDGGDDPNGDDPVVELRIDDGFDARPQAGNDEEDCVAATYKYKDLKDLKMPQLPKDSVEFRSWRNALLTQYSAIDRTSQARILRWLQVCMRPEVTNREIAQLQNDPEQLPRLDSFLASQVSDAKYMKGEFGLEVQAYIERAMHMVFCHLVGRCSRCYRAGFE